jgi:RsiW-degrading membrane proteinase PrsW (M82 family)
MPADLLVPALVGLLPVASFLAALVLLDSYKLVKPLAVVSLVVAGALVAGASYVVNGMLLDALALDTMTFARYVGPIVEEALKSLVLVALIRMHRIGFLVDAAILGFSVGTGFASIENLYYQTIVPDASLGTWIMRGFGTAIMHGGVTAIFAMSGLALLERGRLPGPVAFAPGFVIAVVIHSAYNHLLVLPRLSTLAVLVALPPLILIVFQRSGNAIAAWLGRGFDNDTETLALIESGRFSDSRTGRYLQKLKGRFDGPVVADLLCYLRLHTELSLRAKGLIMMRESGFDVPIDQETRAKFAEMKYLERSIGKTALLALRPMLHRTNKDLWQLTILEE